MKQKIAVVAIGGNAVLRKGEKGTAQEQLANLERSIEYLIALINHGWELVVTHGNGPQVGNVLLQNELAKESVPAMPLDVCGAYTEGGLGYMIQQTLGNALRKYRINKTVVTLITQTEVDLEDPAFKNPTKPIGPFYFPKEAAALAQSQGWQMVEDAGRGYRRVVASPIPRRILEEKAIRALVEHGFVVVAAGGGGIPVIRRPNGTYEGVEAVIDKDYASSILAQNIDADLFVILTGEERVYLNYNRPDQVMLDHLGLAEARNYLGMKQFPPGSMGPKINAAISFVERTARKVLITSPERLGEAMEGRTGTLIG